MQCVVAHCKNRAAKTRGLVLKDNYPVSYHRFPTDERLRQAWIKACRRQKQYFQTVAPSTLRVCSEHFREEDFIRDLRAELLHLKKRRQLKSDAVPTLKLSHLKDDNVKSVCTIEREKRSERKARKELVDRLLEDSTKAELEKKLKQEKTGATNVHASQSPQESLDSEWTATLEVVQSGTPDSSPVYVIADNEMLLLDTFIADSSLDVSQEAPQSLDEGPALKQFREHFFSNRMRADVPDGEISLESLKKDKERLERKNMLLEFNLAKAMDLYRDRAAAASNLKREVQRLKRRTSKQVNAEVAEVLETFLTETQVKVVMNGCKKPKWTESEMAVALKLRRLSERAYIFVQKELNYPLPDLETLYRYASKKRVSLAMSELSAEESDGDSLGGEDFTGRTALTEYVEPMVCTEYEIEVSELPS